MPATEILANAPFCDRCTPVFGAPQVLQSVRQFINLLQNNYSSQQILYLAVGVPCLFA